MAAWRTNIFYISRPYGQVAQLVEQRTENPRVGGSIPSLAIQPFLSFWIGVARVSGPLCFDLGCALRGADRAAGGPATKLEMGVGQNPIMEHVRLG